MIDPAQPTKIERELLIQHYRKAQNLLIRQRAHAILLNSQGYSFLKVSKILFRTEKTIRGWVKRFNQERVSSLFPRYYFNQNAAKLTREQKKEIKEVLSQPPSEYGIPKEFWEVRSLKSYIKAEFGVEFESKESYRLVFKICNFSFHLPARVDKRRDEELVQERLNEIRKFIKPLLKNSDWEVLVGDETRLVWEAIIRRVWLPKGKRSILQIQRDDQYQNFIGFLNLKSGKPHLFKIKWQNQDNVIRVLKLIKRRYPNKRICLIWDNASFHKGKKIREALKNDLKPYHLLNFPPHAPDTNPQEHIWQNAKDQISNHQFNSFFQTIKTFQILVMSHMYNYQI